MKVICHGINTSSSCRACCCMFRDRFQKSQSFCPSRIKLELWAGTSCLPVQIRCRRDKQVSSLRVWNSVTEPRTTSPHFTNPGSAPVQTRWVFFTRFVSSSRTECVCGETLRSQDRRLLADPLLDHANEWDSLLSWNGHGFLSTYPLCARSQVQFPQLCEWKAWAEFSCRPDSTELGRWFCYYKMLQALCVHGSIFQKV